MLYKRLITGGKQQDEGVCGRRGQRTARIFISPKAHSCYEICLQTWLIQTYSAYSIPPPRIAFSPRDCQSLENDAVQVLIHWDRCRCVLFSWGKGLWLLINRSLLRPLVSCSLTDLFCKPLVQIPSSGQRRTCGTG